MSTKCTRTALIRSKKCGLLGLVKNKIKNKTLRSSRQGIPISKAIGAAKRKPLYREMRYRERDREGEGERASERASEREEIMKVNEQAEGRMGRVKIIKLLNYYYACL
jgi:hypothetical protein